MEGFEVLEAEGAAVTYRGETLDIKPLTIGEMPKIIRRARPVLNSVFEFTALPDDEGALLDVALDMIEQHGDALFETAGLFVGRDADWIKGADPAEFVVLCKAIYEVNQSFFAHRLVPLLKQMGLLKAREAAASQALHGTGQTPSSTSSSAATP